MISETETLHITSGDIAGEILSKTGIAGEVFVWHDILYDGPRLPGWPQEDILVDRALFLEETTGGGLNRQVVFATLKEQYERLRAEAGHRPVVLWFDACLFDQAMLAHILACLDHLGAREAELLCIDHFPGIVPFNGLGQLTASQLGSLYDRRLPVTDDQFRFARIVDRAFASQDEDLFDRLKDEGDAPLPWVPAAVSRWLAEKPDPATGLGRLESLALEAVHRGSRTPGEILAAVAAADTPPQYWGDITLWAKINGLADRTPPLVRIEGPAARLPQWESPIDMNLFRIRKP